MLPRTLEPVASDPQAEAETYREMNHDEVNRRFVDDLLNGGPVGPRVIDFGCGPAFIPILLCEVTDQQKNEWVRLFQENHGPLQIMGIDSCTNMLEIAKFELEMAGQVERVQLQQIDLTDPEGLQEEIADTVICNTVFHHLDDPSTALRLALRCLKPGGRLFVRDLYRPASEPEIERLVELHVGQDSDPGTLNADVGTQNADAGTTAPAQLLRQSLHAALTLREIQELLESFGLDPDSVQMTSDRHWTIDCQKT